MPAFEDLPCELRLHILTYAFDDAMHRDLRFNLLIRDCLWDGIDNDSRLVEKYKLPDCLEKFLKHHDDDSWYATHVNDLASNLCTGFPGLKDDVAFIWNKNLEELEKLRKDGLKGAAHTHSGIQVYGKRAAGRKNRCMTMEFMSGFLLSGSTGVGRLWLLRRIFPLPGTILSVPR